MSFDQCKLFRKLDCWKKSDLESRFCRSNHNLWNLETNSNWNFDTIPVNNPYNFFYNHAHPTLTPDPHFIKFFCMFPLGCHSLMMSYKCHPKLTHQSLSVMQKWLFYFKQKPNVTKVLALSPYWLDSLITIWWDSNFFLMLVLLRRTSFWLPSMVRVRSRQ